MKPLSRTKIACLTPKDAIWRSCKPPYTWRLSIAAVLRLVAATAILFSFEITGTNAKEPRFVIAGGMATEVAYALGVEKQIVGIDTTSLHPPEALKQKPSIGYLRALSAEGILSLNPTKFIATSHAGPPSAIAAIRTARIETVLLKEPKSQQDIIDNIIAVGSEVDRKEQARQLVENVSAKFEALAKMRSRLGERKKALFVLSIQNGKVTAGGRNTSADLVMQLAGLTNAAKSIEGYKPLNSESIPQLSPDYIVMMTRGAHAMKSEELFANPAFKLTPAANGRKLITMDGLLLLGLGPRSPDAARELLVRIYGSQDARQN